MTIEDRNLGVGTKLVAGYKGTIYHAEVVETEGGTRYRLSEAPFSEFKSPSAAGSQIMGGTACNGWRFWSVVGTEAAKPKAAKKAAKKNGNPGNGLITRLEDGRWFCNACMKAFDAPKDVKPLGCPDGHSPDGETASPEKEAATA